MNRYQYLFLISILCLMLVVPYFAFRGISRCVETCKPYAVYAARGLKTCICDTRYKEVGEK